MDLATTAQRAALITELRAQGVPYHKIGAELGLTRQRVTQIFEEARDRQTAPPRTCWCGTAIPRSMRGYRPRDGRPPEPLKYCKPEHEPHATGLITKGRYRELVEAQGNLCAICGCPQADRIDGTVKQLAVDHCHESDRVRELLCTNCNLLLGSAKDDPELLTVAVAYLAKHRTAPRPCWCGSVPAHHWGEHPKTAASCITCGIQFVKPRKAKRCIDCSRMYTRIQQQYHALAAIQGSVCAICNKPETQRGKFGHIRKLSVDHCHSSGNVRELLCSACNSILGSANDNPRVLTAAAKYLRKHQANWTLF